MICGNSLRESTYRELLGSRRAAMVFTDPPYNVRVDGHATGNGAIRHREFAMACGEMSEVEFISFLINDPALIAISAPTTPSTTFAWTGVMQATSLPPASRTTTSSSTSCVWVKNQGGMGSFYRSQHELVFVFRKGKGHTGTTSNSANSAATGPTSGSTQESRPSQSRARKGIFWPFTQRSNRSPWWPTPFLIARRAAR